MGVFDDIYTNNHWGFGSGHGSLPSVTKTYREYLEQFIRDNNITSVVDYGCGDWQFSKLIDWGDATYTGLDIVPSVVEEDTKLYGSDKIKFQVIKPGDTNLPKGDLIISKDVLQHMSDEAVQTFVDEVVPRYKYALITNCVLPAEDINKSITAGDFRPLDLRQAPYNVKAAAVHTFVGKKNFSRTTNKFFPAWKKHVLLITN
ncbi:MAG TPA: class I SAM-dependent methyltransferase [Candidatus Saccharimonadales bacterium]|nr:class I SAM-dependent methyltransferase [Candidatus Saccharimonadales bacterium]